MQVTCKTFVEVEVTLTVEVEPGYPPDGDQGSCEITEIKLEGFEPAIRFGGLPKPILVATQEMEDRLLDLCRDDLVDTSRDDRADDLRDQQRDDDLTGGGE